MAGFWREHYTKRYERSHEWSKVRKTFINIPGNDVCAVCGKKGWKAGLQVHHVVPFSVDHTKELDFNNLITLCQVHHLWVGHLGWFQSWNSQVRNDAEIMRQKILNRPSKKKQQSWSDQFWSMFNKEGE